MCRCCEHVRCACGLYVVQMHSPCKLPPDLKRFYASFNGCSLTWTVAIAKTGVHIAVIRVSSLEELRVCARMVNARDYVIPTVLHTLSIAVRVA
jgi:hypothetical protein